MNRTQRLRPFDFSATRVVDGCLSRKYMSNRLANQRPLGTGRAGR